VKFNGVRTDFREHIAAHEPAPRPRERPEDVAFWLSSRLHRRPKGTSTRTTIVMYGGALRQRDPGMPARDLCYSAAKLFSRKGRPNRSRFRSRWRSVLDDGGAAHSGRGLQRWTRRSRRFSARRPGTRGMTPRAEARHEGDVSHATCLFRGRSAARDSANASPRTTVGNHRRHRLDERMHILLSTGPGAFSTEHRGRCPLRGRRGRGDEDAHKLVADGEIGDSTSRAESASCTGQARQSRKTFQGAWTKTGDKYQRDAVGKN